MSIQSVETVIKFLTLHIVMTLVLSFFENPMLIKSGVILMAVMLFYLFARNKIHNGLLFVFVHIVPLFLLAVFLNGAEYVVVLSACAFTAFDSFMIRYKNRETKSISSLNLFLFMICFFIGVYFGKKEFLTVCTVEIVIFLGCKFLFDGLAGTREFLAINENVSNMPVKAIKKKTGIFLLFFTLFSVIAMIIGINSGLGEVLENIGKNILHLLGNLFKREHQIESTQLDFSVRPNTELPDMSVYNLKKGREIPVIIKSIFKIFFQSILLIGAVYVFRMLVIKMKDFLSGLYDTKDENEISEFALPDKEKIVLFNRQTKIFSNFKISKTNNEKVRHLYKKYIQKNIQKELSKCLTPEEISKTLNIFEKENDNKIRKIYEKARYSAVNCNDEEVVEIKNLVKRNAKKQN